MSSRKLTIALLGARSAGKSSLIKRYCEGRFEDSYFPTIDYSHFESVTVNNHTSFESSIRPVSVQDESFILKEGCIHGTHVYVFVYSIVSRRSFDLVRILYDEIFGLYGTPIPCVIVGCKSDLEQHRTVNSVEGIELAKEKNSAWIETTSKADINIDKIFEYCVAEVQKMALSSSGVEGQSSRWLTKLLRQTNLALQK
ncbi:P-loop containing nucleoside triphosphate hydrolase protein [Mycena olivaceomarginata]|nr:P-loop containing nucleoside triphosphate hydrolase protein [Mycena olivaceomarginata]